MSESEFTLTGQDAPGPNGQILAPTPAQRAPEPMLRNRPWVGPKMPQERAEPLDHVQVAPSPNGAFCKTIAAKCKTFLVVMAKAR